MTKQTLAKFMVLRPPQLPQTDPIIVSPSFLEDINPLDMTALETPDPLLYNEIKDLSPTATREDFETKAADFAALPYYLPTLTALQADDLVVFINESITYLETINGTTTLGTVRAQLLDIFGDSPMDMLAQDDLLPNYARLWDNLFAQYITSTNPQLREEIMRILRIAQYILTVYPTEFTGNAYTTYLAHKTARVRVHFILPNPEDYFEDPTPTNPSPSTSDEQAALNNIIAAKAALAEIKQTVEVQHRTYRVLVRDSQSDIEAGEPIPAGIENYDSNLIKTDLFDAMSSDSKTFFADRGLDPTSSTLSVAFSTINDYIVEQSAIAYGKVKNKEIIFLHGLAVDRDDLCAKIADLATCYQYAGNTLPSGKGKPLMIGYGDLKVLESQIYKYELGEIAHIDNVLKGQYKERVFRDLRKTEETLNIDEESTTEKVKETQSTERSELNKEISNVVANDSQFSVGLNVTNTTTYPMGVLTIGAGVNYASSTSQSQSDSVAQSYSKELVSKAVDRVVSSVRTQRSFTRTLETEETNTNKLDNTGSEDNLAGVFRWVNKVYYNKVLNYGRRLMFEFVVPEPAAFYVYQKMRRIGEERTVLKPIDPTVGTSILAGIRSFNDITVDNYSAWCALYNVPDVTNPPVEVVTVSRAMSHTKVDADETYTEAINDMEVPAGYWCTDAVCRGGGSFEPDQKLTMRVGKQWMGSGYASSVPFGYFYSTGMNNETDKIPIAITSFNCSWNITVEAICKVRPETIKEWKVKTYKAIIAAYNNMLKDYEAAMAKNVSQDFTVIQGQNPLKNREIEREEMKKHAISMVTRQRFTSFDAMVGSDSSDPVTRYPEFSFEEAETEGRYIQFFEQVFDWKNIMYSFYPYFWGRKFTWVEKKSFQDTDPIFEKFLQAGAARIVVSVSEGYEKAILHYLATGEIWQGADVPEPTDPLYQDVYHELTEERPEDESEPWLTTVPTELVYLQEDNSLPDFSMDLPL